MQTTDKTFWFQGDYSARELLGGKIGFNERGAFIIDGFTTPPAKQRGSFWTSIPISDKEYRAKHSTKAAYFLNDRELVIYCDWGRRHIINGPRELLESIAAECADQGLEDVSKRLIEDVPATCRNAINPGRQAF